MPVTSYFDLQTNRVAQEDKIKAPYMLKPDEITAQNFSNIEAMPGVISENVVNKSGQQQIGSTNVMPNPHQKLTESVDDMVNYQYDDINMKKSISNVGSEFVKSANGLNNLGPEEIKVDQNPSNPMGPEKFKDCKNSIDIHHKTMTLKQHQKTGVNSFNKEPSEDGDGSQNEGAEGESKVAKFRKKKFLKNVKGNNSLVVPTVQQPAGACGKVLGNPNLIEISSNSFWATMKV